MMFILVKDGLMMLLDIVVFFYIIYSRFVSGTQNTHFKSLWRHIFRKAIGKIASSNTLLSGCRHVFKVPPTLVQ